MRFSAVQVLVLAAATAVSGQWLEDVIILPDSLSGIENVDIIEYVPGSNSVFLAGEGESTLVVLDAATHAKIARIPVHGEILALACGPSGNKVYCSTCDPETVYVVDAGTNQISVRMPVRSDLGVLCVNPVARKLYGLRSQYDSLTIIDCRGDTLVSVIDVGGRTTVMCCSPATNRLYVALRDSGALAVVDGEGDSVVAVVPVGARVRDILHNPVSGKVYCALQNEGEVVVVDVSGDTVLSRIPCENPSVFGFARGENKVYCSNRGYRDLYSICGYGDSLVGTLALEHGVEGMVYDSADNVLYCDMSSYKALAVVDCVTDSLVDSVVLGAYCGALEYDPADRLVYAGGSGVRVVDAAARVVVDELDFWMRPVNACYNRVENKVYFGCEEAEVAVVDGASNSVRGVVPVGAYCAWGLYHSPFENKLYCGSEHEYDSTVTVIDGTADTVLAELETECGPHSFCSATPVSAVSKVYCANGWDNTLSVIDGARDSVLKTFPVGPGALSLVYVPVHDRLFCATTYNWAVAAVDCARDSLIRLVPLDARPTKLCHVPPHDRVCAGNDDGSFHVIDPGALEVVGEVEVGSAVSDIVYNPLDDEVWCALWSGELAAVDCRSWTVASRVPMDQCPFAVVFDSVADRFYCLHEGTSKVTVVDCEVDSVVAEIAVAGTDPYGIAWNPVERRVYVACNEGSCVTVLADSAVAGVRSADLPAVPEVLSVPTFVRGMLLLDGVGMKGRGGTALLDAAGRKVVDLQPGNNDISRLSPGVYFVHARAEGGGLRAEQGNQTWKIVIQR